MASQLNSVAVEFASSDYGSRTAAKKVRGNLRNWLRKLCALHNWSIRDMGQFLVLGPAVVEPPSLQEMLRGPNPFFMPDYVF